MNVDVSILLSVISLIGVIVAIVSNIKSIERANEQKRKEQEDFIRWQQKLDCKLEVIDQRLSEHNGYAKKFSECTEDISKCYASIAKIEGKLEAKNENL